MKKLMKYSLLALLSTGLVHGASQAIINNRLARLTGHVVVMPITVAKKLAVAKTNAEMQAAPQELTQDQQKEISDVIDGLVVETNIAEYAEKNDWEQVEKMIATPGTDLNAKGEYGYTVLTRAAELGHLLIIQRLVDLKDSEGKLLVDVNARVNNISWAPAQNMTALMCAAQEGHLAVVQFLLNLKDSTGRRLVDVDAEDSSGRTALMCAAEKDYNLPIVEYFINNLKDAHGNIVVDLKEVLMAASRRGSLSIVRFLLGLKNSAGRVLLNANVKDGFGYTALMWAANNGRFEVVEYLVALRDETGQPVVDLNAKSDSGETALMIARREYRASSLVYIKRNCKKIAALLEQAERERAQQPTQIPSRL